MRTTFTEITYFQSLFKSVNIKCIMGEKTPILKRNRFSEKSLKSNPFIFFAKAGRKLVFQCNYELVAILVFGLLGWGLFEAGRLLSFFFFFYRMKCQNC